MKAAINRVPSPARARPRRGAPACGMRRRTISRATSRSSRRPPRASPPTRPARNTRPGWTIRSLPPELVFRALAAGHPRRRRSECRGASARPSDRRARHNRPIIHNYRTRSRRLVVHRLLKS